MTLKDIKLKTEEYFGFRIHTKNRKLKYTKAREFYSVISSQYGFGSTEISKSINRTHASIINSRKRHAEKLIYKEYKREWLTFYLYILDIQPEKEVKVIEIETNTQFNKTILNIANELKKLNDSDILEFTETRLKPFLIALKSRKQHKEVERIAGASIKGVTKNPFLTY